MGKNLAKSNTTIFFCDGGSCNKAGSETVTRTARAYLRNNNLWDTTHTIKTRCNGRCEDAPTCIIQEGDYWYKKLTAEKIIPIMKSHFEKNEPLTEHLLYKKDWSEIISENERKKVEAKPFEQKEHPTLGKCWITKGFSSDQYLFPLFLKLFETKEKATLHIEGGSTYCLNELENVTYNDPYAITLQFKNDTSVSFIIGFVPKTQPDELIKQKITSTEYFVKLNNRNKGIQFKDKMGNLVASIQFDANQKELWQYCLSVQLLGLENPEKKLIDA